MLNEALLEDARQASGERTYSGTINKALEAVVKNDRFRRSLAEFEREAAKGGFFDPEYLAEKSANSMLDEPKPQLSANEKRAPRTKKSARRAAR